MVMFPSLSRDPGSIMREKELSAVIIGILKLHLLMRRQMLVEEGRHFGLIPNFNPKFFPDMKISKSRVISNPLK